MRLFVQITEFPDDSIDPFVGQILFGIGHLHPRQTDYVVEPIAHSTRKVFEYIVATGFDVFALTIIVNVHVFVLVRTVLGIGFLLKTIATMFHEVAVRLPSFVVVGTDTTSKVIVLWTGSKGKNDIFYDDGVVIE
ncbi:hypothetical protein BLA29_002043 [Euroglyphus maynei]|uniref:Uncharacterized protein n=1 Tax=Euroglyphus maynei TaxID=6958 RepID=A0A1Y3BNI2_EURMA|nr:hypothetical protein BLA29_002043 [Euroglyphus maynei]